MGKYSGLIQQATSGEPEEQPEQEDAQRVELKPLPSIKQSNTQSATATTPASQAVQNASKHGSILQGAKSAQTSSSKQTKAQTDSTSAGQPLVGLPSVAVRDRAQLPWGICAVYVVVDPEGVVQFVGMTQNLKQRWVAHECVFSLSPDSQIIYRAVKRDQLTALRDSWLLYFDPPLNRGSQSQPTTDRQLSLTVPAAIYTKAANYAQQQRTTVSELLVTYLQSL
ncbi:MAG: hypothetical protein AAGF24_06490 [Cyanobacteria bacterium P01_H01_bin.121]